MEAVRNSNYAANSEAGDSSIITPHCVRPAPSISEIDDGRSMSISGIPSFPQAISTTDLTPPRPPHRPDHPTPTIAVGRQEGAPLGAWKGNAVGDGADDSAMKHKQVDGGNMNGNKVDEMNNIMSRMDNMSEEEMAKMVCSIENKENCLMCGS